SIFLGYERLEAETRIHKLARRDGRWYVVLVETPFYAESGGQVGDHGLIRGKNFELRVVDVQKEGDEIVHICEGPENLDISTPEVFAQVDPQWREPTMRNHTATHLLHAALRRVLGEHVRQAGSLVAPDRLRFDFTHFKKIDRQELEEIEWLVNEKIQQDLPVEVIHTDYQKAVQMGAMALFGEKYGDRVRVISIDGFSKELCGGTHVRHTGQIGPFVIVQETSVASGIRRVEALTGPRAVQFIQQSRDVVQDLDQLLNCSWEQLPAKVNSLVEQLRQTERALQRLKARQLLEQVDELLKQGKKINGITLVMAEFEDVEIDLLKQLGDRLRQQAQSTVGLFVNRWPDRANLVCAVTDDLIEQKGLKAGQLVKEAARVAGGGGGGRPHLATAGIKQVDKIPQIRKYLEETLQKFA
ncbi:MAG: alanine--tRNA ligase, partial [Calditrichaeota bacterium]